MIELIQIKKLDSNFELSTVFINPNHIIYLSEERIYKSYLREGKMNLGLHKETVFTKVKINEGNKTTELIVVGEPNAVQAKMFNTKAKMLLRD